MLINGQPTGMITPPPSKSISHRGLICAALAGGGTITNVVENIDIERTLSCLAGLGAAYTHGRGTGTVIFSASPAGPKPGTVLDAGESGPTLRFFIPIAAVFGTPVTFTGKGRLMERPLGPYVDCLTPQGVTLEQADGMLTVSGQLQPGTFRLPGDVSSQFVTGLLFALPLLSGDSVIEITSPLQSASYVDLTLSALADFGIHVEHDSYQRFTIPGGQRYRQGDYRVEADYSSAAFLLCSAALGCDVICTGLNPRSAQGDRKILDVLARCGAGVEWTDETTVRVTGGRLHAVTVDVSDIPDLVPPMAVLLCFCAGTSKIVNAARLRIKESDRLMSVAMELNRLGAKITEGPDYLEIQGVDAFTGGSCLSHNDHRIAMMTALASLKATGPVEIDDPDCVQKSYPGFWRDFLQKPAK